MRSWLAVFLKLVFLLIGLFALMPQSALALTASQVYEQVKDSVVVVKAYDQKGEPVGLGSGVMLPSGDIITNFHVVKGGVRYTVGRGTKATPATLKAGDPDKDLCLLTAPGLAAKPARLGKAARLKVGEPVYAVGAPQGLELSLSEGIVSQLRGGPPPMIQTTVAISPGSSGGGLFNAEGELVGITTFYLKDSQSLNFALPVEWIAEVAGRKISVEKVDSWLDRAISLEKAQDWQILEAWCLKWMQAEPRNDLAIKWSKLAKYLIATRKNHDWDSWHELGYSYYDLGRYIEAIEAYRKAIHLKPLFPSLQTVNWNRLGDAYAKIGRYSEAVEAYRQALRVDPDNELARISLGDVYSKLGRHQEAIEAYLEALRRFYPRLQAMTIKPVTPWVCVDAWSGIALSWAKLGNRSAALEAVKELRRYDPQRADQLLNVIIKP